MRDDERQGQPGTYLPAPVPGGEKEARDRFTADAPKPVEARTPPKEQQGPRATFAAIKPPALNLPKGGGALRGIGETFRTNPVTGTASAAIPLPLTQAPRGPTPALSLSYDSGQGNGLFGLGWGVGAPQIVRKTDKALPQYLDRAESDSFVFGGEDLVPRFNLDEGDWVRDTDTATEGTDDYAIQRYRSRTEGAFSKIERWTNTDTLEVHWRVISRDNVTSFFGRTADSRITDPAQPDVDPEKPPRIFAWLLDRTVDDRGHVVEYVYAAEDLTGVSPLSVSEAHRTDGLALFTNRHLKRVRYGNTTMWPTATPGFKFELVFDYGEHHAETPAPDDDATSDWTLREDPFSSYRAGFEMRTYRLCRRVLMFHRFTELHATEPTLIRALELTYDESPKLTQLTGAKLIGYTRDGAGYTTAELPSVTLTYTPSTFTRAVDTLDPDHAQDFNPQSLTQFAQWVDLDGEGLPGVLTDRGGALSFKRNLGEGRLADAVLLPSAPNLSLRDRGTAQLMDVAGSGTMSVVRLDPRASGYFEREADGWAPFQTFAQNPNIDWADPNLRMVDLNGDGFDDILITRGDHLLWIPSLGKTGYGPAQRVPLPQEEEKGPTILFAGRHSSIFLADMSGDGLSDLVQVTHSRVAYWPNLGHGQFGAQIIMDSSPNIERPDRFHPSRVRLADLDGTGTADLLYFDPDGLHIWENQAGNAFGDKLTNECVPVPEALPTLAIVDLHGTGMSTLTWAPRHTPHVPLRHTSPYGKRKPFILESIENGMGLEVRFEYEPSTKSYLADKKAGKPWVTKLPFPVQVVTRVESYDAVSKTRLVTTYAYHHGHYDTVEREFRGFGVVEQTDAETFDPSEGAGLFPELPIEDGELAQPPVLTKTWFHVGAWPSTEAAYAAEYWDGDASAPASLTCVVETSGLSAEETRQAHRALRGSTLRQETFGFTRDGDDWQLDEVPFAVMEMSYGVRRIQPQLPAAGAEHPRLHPVFQSVERESRDLHYDRVADDPRLSQTLALAVDEYGIVTSRAAIAYPRRGSPTHTEQTKLHCVVTEVDVEHLDEESGGYRLGIPHETRLWEVTGLATTLHTIDSLNTALSSASDLAYHQAPTTGVERRIVERVKVRYYDSADLPNPLAFGQADLLAIPYETYQLDLTDDLLTAAMGTRVTGAMLTQGGYVELAGIDDSYWLASGRSLPDATKFFLPVSFTDPFGESATVTYDGYNLLVDSVVDPLGNTVAAESDYRVLTPTLLTDPNGNRVATQLDELGRVLAIALMGKSGDSDGDTLGDPSEEFEYVLDAWTSSQMPNYAKRRAREQHGAGNPRWQESYVYTDGSGRVAMTKIQAEPGLAHHYDGGMVVLDTLGNPELIHTETRWVGSGKTVLNNKGNPTKQYEPFFSPTHAYETEEDLVKIGVTPILTYDAVGRVTRIDLPNETFRTTEWTAWTETAFDENDNQTGGDHEDTPTVTHVDTMGRPFLVVADNGSSEFFETRTTMDIESQVLSVKDALGRICQTHVFSMAGRLLSLSNIDSGSRWMMMDVAGAPIRRWDQRLQVFRFQYDELRRPTHLWVEIDEADEVLLERRYYGEAATDPEDDNLRGKLILIYDGAGQTKLGPFDFKGNLLQTERKLATVYDALVDWVDLAAEDDPADAETAASGDLQSETWPEIREFDALNRITSITTPDASEFLPTYNEANLLEAVDVKVRGAGTATTFVKNIDYNAKGQRTVLELGEDPATITSYSYDPLTFRLTRILTTRQSDSKKLQDLGYTHDPVGNITAITDAAHQDVYFNSSFVSPGQTFTYDATYRLTEGTGREHMSIGDVQIGEDDSPLQVLPHANQSNAVRNYLETYLYDAVGNILELFHEAAGSPVATWTRYYDYGPLTGVIPNTNRLRSSSLSGDTPSTVPYSAANTHDDHGNMTSMPHLSAIDYSPFDQMSHADLDGGGDAYYVYDSAGQRVRKVWVHAGYRDERIYVSPLYEVWRRTIISGESLKEERQTLHVMDGMRRIAMVETLTWEEEDELTSPTPRVRYQLDNHLGTACVEFAEDGAVFSYEEFHPWGTSAYRSGDSAYDVSPRRYRYTGKERDEATGLDYHGLRYRVPWLGRWSTADPLGMVDGPNLYAYARDNPIALSDPSGGESRTHPELQEIGESSGGFVHLPPSSALEQKAQRQRAADHVPISPEEERDQASRQTSDELDPVTVDPEAVAEQEARQQWRQQGWEQYGSGGPMPSDWEVPAANAHTLGGALETGAAVVPVVRVFGWVAKSLGRAIQAGRGAVRGVTSVGDDAARAVDKAFEAEKAVNPSLGLVDDVGGARHAAGGGERFVGPKVFTNRHRQLTNGLYILDDAGMAPHTTGSLAKGRSQFLYHVNEKQLTLDAAAYADEAGLWVGNKAKVVLDDFIGVHAGTGQRTQVLNIYRTDSGFIHAAPGSPL